MQGRVTRLIAGIATGVLGLAAVAAASECNDLHSGRTIDLIDLEPIPQVVDTVDQILEQCRRGNQCPEDLKPPDLKVADVTLPGLALCDARPTVVFSNGTLADLLSSANGTWPMRAVFAHELGHHARRHLFDKTTPRNDKEQEADQFSGRAICIWGGRYQDAIAGLRLASPTASRNYASRRDREEAVLGGWIEAIQEGVCSASKLVHSSELQTIVSSDAANYRNTAFISSGTIQVTENVDFRNELILFANRIVIGKGTTLAASKLHIIAEELILEKHAQLQTDGVENGNAGDLVIVANHIRNAHLSARGAPGLKGADITERGLGGRPGLPGPDAQCPEVGPPWPARPGEDGEDGEPGTNGGDGQPGGDGGRILLFSPHRPTVFSNVQPGKGGAGGKGGPGGIGGPPGAGGRDCNGRRLDELDGRPGQDGPDGLEGREGPDGQSGRYSFILIQPKDLFLAAQRHGGEAGAILREFLNRLPSKNI